MTARVSFSEREPTALEVIVWLREVRAELRRKEDDLVRGAVIEVDWVGRAESEIRAHYALLQAQSDAAAALLLFTAAEAVLRRDYLSRVYNRDKSDVGRAFRAVYKRLGPRAALDDDILDVWTTHAPSSASAVTDLRGALRYRHWLAHGRYWVPKLGRDYDSDEVFGILDACLAHLPGVDGWPG